jgi:hypothetical protein
MTITNLSSTLRQWLLRSIIEAGWAPLLVFGLHVLMSRLFDAYRRFPGIDIPMHFLGGVVIAYFFHRASINASQLKVLGRFHAVTHVLLVFFATCSATVFWEFAEFINDRYFGGHSQAGLFDTMKDMFIGVCGGVVLLLGVMPRLARLFARPISSNL